MERKRRISEKTNQDESMYVLWLKSRNNRWLIRCDVGRAISVDFLPDDILLEIFDFCVVEDRYTKKAIEAWQSLVHVCQRWRSVVFGSPRRLNLRLVCAARTPARDTLDVWPALPLIIMGCPGRLEEIDNVIAALEHSDRVRQISIHSSSYHFEDVWATMQKPFPVLRHLLLSSSEAQIVLSDSLFNWSAPDLQTLRLDDIPFPSLPKLLSSSTHLKTLDLNIGHSEHFSLDAIVVVLSTLTSLNSFCLQFHSPVYLPDKGSRHPPLLTRSVLPFLTSLRFKGASKYLEDLVARIDAPRLDSLHITFVNEGVFNTPQTIQFIDRTSALKAREHARLVFKDIDDTVNVELVSQTLGSGDGIFVRTRCSGFDMQLSALKEVCTSFLLPLSKVSMLEVLCIYENPYRPPYWKDKIDQLLWLELLHHFSAAKTLYLSEEIAPRIAHGLQEFVEDRTTEVLPMLQHIFLEGLQPSGPDQEGIVTFVAARQLSSRPITVSLWERHPERPGMGSSLGDR